jgi:hypothetical protein
MTRALLSSAVMTLLMALVALSGRLKVGTSTSSNMLSEDLIKLAISAEDVLVQHYAVTPCSMQLREQSIQGFALLEPRYITFNTLGTCECVKTAMVHGVVQLARSCPRVT